MKNYHTNPIAPTGRLEKSGFTLLECLIMFGLLFIVSMIAIALYLHSENDNEAATADIQAIEESAINAADTSSIETPPSDSQN